MTTLALDPRTAPAHPGALVRELAATRELWAPHVRFDPTSPRSGVVWADDRHEAMITTWLPGQASPVRRHVGRPGALLVLQGVLEETTWVTASDGDEPGRQHAVRRALGVDEVRSHGAVHVHGLRNAGVDPVVALHVLARPDA